MKKAIIMSVLSVIAILLFFIGTFAKVGYVESNDRDVDSFSDMALWMGVASGVIMMFVAFWTYKIHIVAGIIPLGTGATIFFSCLYLLWCKTL